MRVSEKSLELNVGAELLWLFRNAWGMPKAYLRGLTQTEEKQEGFDFSAQLSASAVLFAFQFKAPQGGYEGTPYRFKLVKEQHKALRTLSQVSPTGVFYVFPFYSTVVKLRLRLPDLLSETWFLRVAAVSSSTLFDSQATRTVLCEPGMASINPAYGMEHAKMLQLDARTGIPVKDFRRWYLENLYTDGVTRQRHRRHPWRVRGLRLVIVDPEASEAA